MWEPAVFVAARYIGWYRTAAASSDETVRSSGSKTGHSPRGTGHRPPPSRTAHRSGPRVIGGRIFDDTVLVGFALGSPVYVLAAGKLACPGRAAPHGCVGTRVR